MDAQIVFKTLVVKMDHVTSYANLAGPSTNRKLNACSAKEVNQEME